MSRFEFPEWVNRLVPWGLLVALVGVVYTATVLAYAVSPETLHVGYEPEQPVPFSHKLHVGKLKMDCRYCHTTVEQSAFAAVPPTKTCANCHSGADATGVSPLAAIHASSPRLLKVRESQATGEPIEWIKVHDLPDFVYFNHSAHVTRGVSCVACHGRVDTMDVVRQVEPLSMAWCLDCHRNPDRHLRPIDRVTQLDWTPDEDPARLGARLRQELNIHPSTDCSTCHR